MHPSNWKKNPLEVLKNIETILSANGSKPFSRHWYLSMPPENIREPFIFWCISGSIEKDQCYEMG